MRTITLKWNGPFKFRDLLTNRERYEEFGTAGVYVQLCPTAGGSWAYSYLGRASRQRHLMHRLVDRYLGLLTLHYFINTRLTQKSRSADEFAEAVALVNNRERHVARVQKEFDDLGTHVIFLAPCSTEDAAVAESHLQGEWDLASNQRHERVAARLGEEVHVVHDPSEPLKLCGPGSLTRPPLSPSP